MCAAAPGYPGGMQHPGQHAHNKEHTGDDLRPLEVLVGMEVARREGEPQPDEDQKKIGPSPHGPNASGLRQVIEIVGLGGAGTSGAGSEAGRLGWLGAEVHHRGRTGGRRLREGPKKREACSSNRGAITARTAQTKGWARKSRVARSGSEWRLGGHLVAGVVPGQELERLFLRMEPWQAGPAGLLETPTHAGGPAPTRPRTALPGSASPLGDLTHARIQTPPTSKARRSLASRAPVCGACPQPSDPLRRQPPARRTSAEIAYIAKRSSQELPGRPFASPMDLGHVSAGPRRRRTEKA